MISWTYTCCIAGISCTTNIPIPHLPSPWSCKSFFLIFCWAQTLWQSYPLEQLTVLCGSKMRQMISLLVFRPGCQAARRHINKNMTFIIYYLVVSNIFYFHPYLGKIPILTNIFQMGWNHQLISISWRGFTFQQLPLFCLNLRKVNLKLRPPYPPAHLHSRFLFRHVSKFAESR